MGHPEGYDFDLLRVVAMGSVLPWLIAAVLIWLVWRFVARIVKAASEPSPSPGDDAEVGAHLKPGPRGGHDATAIEPEIEPVDDDLVSETKLVTDVDDER